MEESTVQGKCKSIRFYDLGDGGWLPMEKRENAPGTQVPGQAKFFQPRPAFPAWLFAPLRVDESRILDPERAAWPPGRLAA
jgi:hypothetical protein